MCKVMMLTNGAKIKDVKKLVNVVQDLITATDKHGFGWAAQGANGVFGERMTEMFHGYRLEQDKHKVLLPLVKSTYNSIGTKSEIVGPVLFHGRTSTNDKTLINTHPIAKSDWYLIHNGVVNNQGPKYKMTTTNDTEHVLHYLSTVGISGVAENLTGYYAVGAIDPTGRLHVIRDNVASLFVCWNRTLESYQFATTAELLKKTAELMKYKIGPIDKVNDNVYSVFELNKITVNETFTPRGYDYQEARHATASLGRSVGSVTTYENGKVITGSSYYKSGNRWNDYSYDDDFTTSTTSPASCSIDTKVDTLIESALSNVDSYESLLESDEAQSFFDETSSMDLSFSITNGTGDPISPYEFDKLTDLEQLECIVIRPDGTELSLDALVRENSSAV